MRMNVSMMVFVIASYAGMLAITWQMLSAPLTVASVPVRDVHR